MSDTNTTQSPTGLTSRALFVWFRSWLYLRWHLAHLVWVASAIPLVGFAGWKAIFDGDAAWSIFISGWVAAGIWLRVDSFLEGRANLVRDSLAAEIDAEGSATEANRILSDKNVGIPPK